MKLNEEHKAFLVMAWARYLTSEEVRKEFVQRFGCEIDHRQAADYNCDSTKANRLVKWLPLFDDTRQRFLTEVDSTPIAHRGYRLRKLQDMFEKALNGSARPNIPLAASLLEQAAKEAGGALTNVSRVEGKVTLKDEAPALDDGEKRALIVAAIEDALNKRRPEAATRH